MTERKCCLHMHNFTDAHYFCSAAPSTYCVPSPQDKTRSMDLTWIVLDEGTQGRERINHFISIHHQKEAKVAKSRNICLDPPHISPHIK